DGDRHHLERVLRVRPGTPVSFADGTGRWRAGRFGASPEVDGPVRAEPRTAPAVTIAFALVKGERPELVVQKLTEPGADVVVPFDAARGVVCWDDVRAARNLDRLRRIAREAAMQCR